MGSFKKMAGGALAATMLAGVLAGCSGNDKNEPDASTAGSGGNKAAGETIKLTFVSPGAEPTDAQKRWDAINGKLKADGLNLEIKFEFIGWDAWEQKTNLMLSTNESFDNLTIMEDWIKTSAYAGRGAILPLDEYLDKYPNLKAAFPDYVWENTRINGKIYSLPVFYREWANDYELISYRKDLLDKYSLPVPKTIQEMIDAADKIKKGENNPNLYIVQKPNAILNHLHREYDTYPFNVVDDLIYIDQQGNVKPWMETPEFKQDVDYFRQMYTKGLIHPDVLTLPLDQVTKTITDGDALFTPGNVLYSADLIKTNNPAAVYDMFRLAPEKQKMRPLLIQNANAIPKTSKHPEAMIQFFDWLYSSQDNFDLLTYGIKDDWFKDAGPGKMEKLRPVGTEVQFDEWKVGYYKYIRFPTTADPSIAKYQTIDDTVVNAINTGFVFDSTPVSVEYSNLLAEIKSSIYPLKMGAADYDKFYPSALEKMKSAGLDKVVQEYGKQFKAWLAAKGK